MYPVSITSQGQISIPMPLRRILGLSAGTKAMVSIDNGKIVIEPVVDFLSLAGTFKTKKKYSAKKIDEGFAKYMAEQGVAGLK